MIDNGPATSISLSGRNNVLDWSVTVSAHNAAGWSPWSKLVVLGGL